MKYIKILAVLLLVLVVGYNTYQVYDKDVVEPMTREELQELAEGTGAAKVRGFYGIDGEATGDLDDVDASLLNDLDMGIVIMADGSSYFYTLDDNSGATEDIPNVVTPSGTAGDKRWILSGRISSLTNYEEIQMSVVEWVTEVATGDGKFYFHIGERLNGMNLVYVHAN